MRPHHAVTLAVAAIGLYVAVVAVTGLRPLERAAKVENRIGDLAERARHKVFGPPEPARELISTGLLVLSKTTHYLEPRPGNYGGAWFRLDDRVYLMGSKGEVVEYLGQGRTASVPLRAPINYADFHSDIADTEFDFWEARAHFRVVDAYGRRFNGAHELVVLHNYWDTNDRVKLVRLSRLVVDDPDSLSKGVGRWTTLLECKTRIEPAATSASAYASNRNGGRIAEDDAGRLLVGFGDHTFDGVALPSGPLVDPEGCFGKVLRIETTTGDWEVYAEGLRNPEGLLVDQDGRVWETEHGPRGGDELNLLEEGIHYGWPYVTYGTRYQGPPYVWPSNPRQGRHDGYRSAAAAWLPSIGVSNLIQVVHGPPEWQGDLLIGSLRAGNLYRGRITDGHVMILETIPIGHRIRDLMEMDDGTLLLWTDSWAVIELARSSATVSDLLPDPLSPSEEARGLGETLMQCATCHSFSEGEASAAPSLYGVLGRAVAGTEYPYSQGLREHGGDWTEDRLRAFIGDPSGFAPGTTMPQTGLSEAQAGLVVDYLARLR